MPNTPRVSLTQAGVGCNELARVGRNERGELRRKNYRGQIADLANVRETFDLTPIFFHLLRVVLILPGRRRLSLTCLIASANM
jgi:hypothetical protein